LIARENRTDPADSARWTTFWRYVTASGAVEELSIRTWSRNSAGNVAIGSRPEIAAGRSAPN
jgi:hypothetical protein